MRSLNPNFRQLLQNPIHLLAFGFGAGLFVKAPGTVGTLLGILVWVFLAKLAIASYIIVLVIVTLFGVYICGKTAKDLKAHDPTACRPVFPREFLDPVADSARIQRLQNLNFGYVRYDGRYQRLDSVAYGR